MTLLQAGMALRPPPGLRLASVSALLLAGLMLFGPWLAPYDPTEVALDLKLMGPSLAHPLGTDHLGRDVLSRLMAGAQVSLGAVAAILALVLTLGVGIGSLAGMAGGRTDAAIMRVCDAFLTIPTFILALFFVGVLGTGPANVVTAVVLSHWAWYARMARALVAGLKRQDYVLAARVAGTGRLMTVVRHILPAVLAQMAILASLDIGHMMLHVSGLSFLGLGVTPPDPEWGVMINDARAVLWTQPVLVLWPGLMIMLTVMTFNRLGDGLRDALDPALQAGGKAP
ncbi:nickel ABC transporter permease subunit NikC [Azospirillum sp. SYSU D00513]|uniref:nickel ABC transporter permease subunit NikC n=1 Tax=Azospirillum sp. SYSU D00513 TaxID=2812561 RepID=UPI001A9727AA|nr:nickel ABC transporter permease subunit NikC [Azospirillum sp. SYSU D00513]